MTPHRQQVVRQCENPVMMRYGQQALLLQRQPTSIGQALALGTSTTLTTAVPNTHEVPVLTIAAVATQSGRAADTIRLQRFELVKRNLMGLKEMIEMLFQYRGERRFHPGTLADQSTRQQTTVAPLAYRYHLTGL